MAMLSSLALAFALVSAQTLQPPTPSAMTKPCNQGDAQCKGVKTQPNANLQGSKASPLWVNVDCPGCPKIDSNQNADKGKNKSANRRRDDPNWWIAWFTGILAIIAFGQVWLFLYQLRLIKESMVESKTAANAAGKAADAAKRSADIATNAERAWVVTDATFSSDWPDLMKKGAPDKSKVILKVKNTGRSPAELEQVEILAFVYPANYAFPAEPVYDDGSKGSLGLDLMPGEIIQAGEDRVMICSIQNFEILDDAEIGRLRRRETRLCCYGRINYKDISGSPRVTQFGYSFYVRTSPEDDIPEAMYRLRNRAYNYTS
jgi:hypothetical protein